MTSAEIDVLIKITQTVLSAPSFIAIIALFIFPWVALVWTSARQERRFESVVKMYENNVGLVNDYQELVDGYKKIVDGQQDLIIHVTQVMTAVHDAVRTNSFCPQVRKESQR